MKNAQIEIIEKNKNSEIDKLEQIENKIKTIKEIEKEKMKSTYSDQIDIYEINKLFNCADVDEELEKLQNESNERKLEIHKINLNKENIMPQLDDLAKVEEEINIAEEEYNELMKKNNAMNIVKQALEDEEKSVLDEIQELINKYNKIVDEKFKEKETELMTV